MSILYLYYYIISGLCETLGYFWLHQEAPVVMPKGIDFSFPPYFWLANILLELVLTCRSRTMLSQICSAFLKLVSEWHS